MEWIGFAPRPNVNKFHSREWPLIRIQFPGKYLSVERRRAACKHFLTGPLSFSPKVFFLTAQTLSSRIHGNSFPSQSPFLFHNRGRARRKVFLRKKRKGKFGDKQPPLIPSLALTTLTIDVWARRRTRLADGKGSHRATCQKTRRLKGVPRSSPKAFRQIYKYVLPWYRSGSPASSGKLCYSLCDAPSTRRLCTHSPLP